jgi:hypothetical protein
MDHHFPMRLDKSVGQLALCRSSNNFGLAIDEILAEGQIKELEITVQVEAVCQQPSCSSEKAKRRDDVLGRERLQAKSPIVTGGAVDKDERVAITANSNTVSERDVHVHGVEVIVFCMIKKATLFGYWNCCIRAKGEGKLAAINPLSVSTDLQKMFVIPELATAHDVIELFCRPMGLCVGSISGVAGLNQGEGSARMMKMAGNLLWSHGGEKKSDGFVGSG